MAGIPDLKTITSLAKKAFTIEEQEQIISLRDALVELKAEGIEQKEQIADLKKQLAELKKKIDIQDRLVWETPYYFLKDGEKNDGPYCQLCWDKEQKLIRLQGGKSGEWHCHCCDNRVADKNYTPSPPRAIMSRRSRVYCDGL